MSTTIRDESRGILEKAALLLDRYGWTRGVARDNAGRYCITGAVLDVCQGQLASAEAWKAALDAVDQALPDTGGGVSLTRWNDCLCKNGNEAVELLRQAANLVGGRS